MKEVVHHELKRFMNQSMRETTSRFGGIELMEQDVILSDDVCTVHTTLEENGPSVLALYADTALLTRLAQNIMHSDVVTPQDVEDVAKEYFNVICGQFAAGLFRVAKVSSRFQIPSFCTGIYRPHEENVCRCALHYHGGDGGMCLIYMGPDQLQTA